MKKIDIQSGDIIGIIIIAFVVISFVSLFITENRIESKINAKKEECYSMEPKHEWGEIYVFDKHEGDYVKTDGCIDGKYKSKSECLDKTRYKTYKYDYEGSDSYYYVVCKDDGSWDRNNISPYSTQEYYWANEK